MILIDTNIVLRLILDDDSVLSPRARSIFEKIGKGKIKVFLSLLTLSEIVFTLERSYKIPRSEIVKSLLQLFRVKSLTIERQKLAEKAFIFYANKNISFPDAYHVALMEKKRINNIVSFDSDFDKFPEIKRITE